MNTPKLPPLPEKIFIPSGLGFTKDDMQAYAISAIAAQGAPDGWTHELHLQKLRDLLDEYRSETANETYHGSHFCRRSPAVIRKEIDELIASAPPAPQATTTKSVQVMLHDFPYLQQFHTRHALGSLLPPSCLCCGQQTHPINRAIAVKHMELPNIVICEPCHTKATSIEAAVVQQEPVGVVTSYHTESGHAEWAFHPNKSAWEIPQDKKADERGARSCFAVYTNTAKQANPQPLSDARIAELERQLAEARKDAERYRWLRSIDDIDTVFKVVKEPGRWEVPYSVLLQEDELDAAIDNAMQKG